MESTLANNRNVTWNKRDVASEHFKRLLNEMQTMSREEFFRYDLNPERRLLS